MRAIRLVVMVVLVLLSAHLVRHSALAEATCFGQPVTISGAGTINGFPGNDVIFGSSGTDVLNRKGGNDLICSLGGNDRVAAGVGNVKIDTRSGSYLVVLGLG